MKWTGKKIGSQHYGYIQVKEGYLEMKDGKISGGTFLVDMNSISNVDLKNEEFNKKLVDHLKSDDFFSVAQHPTSRLVIEESTPFRSGKATVKGMITIKGMTEPISFDVIRSGNVYEATLSIDRSKFDVRFGSDSFFDNLGDRAIDDIFTLEVKLVM